MIFSFPMRFFILTMTLVVGVKSWNTLTVIPDKSYTSGFICCPCAEQLFRFTATRTGKYTICTTGSLDTIGTLYDCCGNQIVEVDDYVPCGILNFRIIRNLILLMFTIKLNHQKITEQYSSTF